MDGHIRVAEVGADGSLTWLKHQIIQDGEFAYNSIQDLGNDEFGLLYEHKTGGQNWYSLHYKTFNWNYLMQKDYGLPVSRVTAIDRYQEGYVTLTFNNTVLAVNRPNLLLSNGHQLEFVSQLEANKLLYRLDPADKSEVIVGLSSGELVNVSKLPVTVLAFLDAHPTKLIQKVNGKKVHITGEDVFEEARGNGLANLMDGNKGSLTELKWLVAGQPSVSLPQTINLALPEEKVLHSMVITKRTPGNGTMTKYRVKAFLGE
ncbi:exo-alpha-sialidase [Streptococcus suis]|nr:exo-alpha-sialidase [Streptococcus suis]